MSHKFLFLKKSSNFRTRRYVGNKTVNACGSWILWMLMLVNHNVHGADINYH